MSWWYKSLLAAAVGTQFVLGLGGNLFSPDGQNRIMFLLWLRVASLGGTEQPFQAEPCLPVPAPFSMSIDTLQVLKVLML